MSYYDDDEFVDVYTGRVLEEGDLGNRDCEGVTRLCNGCCDSCGIGYSNIMDFKNNDPIDNYNRYNPGYTEDSFNL